MGERIIRYMQELGKLPWLFLGLLRRSGGHDDIDAIFFKASDQLEEDPRSSPLIKSGYEL
jgi:hypothetical protein